MVCIDLQSFRHNCFSKISRTLFDFLNNTYWVSLFLRNNSLIFWTGVSCFSVTLFYFTLFCCGGKANLVRFTLFYSTLLTLTDGQNDRQRNELILCGLGNQKKLVPPGKRTTLRRLKILLQSIHSKEGLHYCLGAKRKESCHLTSNNQPLFTNWISSGDSILGLYRVAWLMQESVSSRIFVPETWGRMYDVLALRN